MRQVWCVAYEDEHPHMDGPKMIRMGEFLSLERAEEALHLLQTRSVRAPKRDEHIETRFVSEWSREEQPQLRLGSCCVNVGTDACTCEHPTNWDINTS